MAVVRYRKSCSVVQVGGAIALLLVCGGWSCAWGQSGVDAALADMATAAESPTVASAQAQVTAEGSPVQKAGRSLRVFGEDDRRRIEDTTELPWSAIGVVEARWDLDGAVLVSTGTGTLIGSRVVLTCGHCVYDQTDGWADRIVFIPGKNGEQEPFGRANVTRSIAQNAWVEHGDNEYDLAMLVLDSSLGDRAGYMSIVVETAPFFVDRVLNLAGYPAENGLGGYQYHASGEVRRLEGNLIQHEIDSEPGQSGSPLWAYEPATGERELVGVLTGSRELHIGEETTDAFNVAVHMNSGFANWIWETLAEYDTVNPDVKLASSTGDETVVPVCGAGTAGAVGVSLAVMSMACVAARRRDRRSEMYLR